MFVKVKSVPEVVDNVEHVIASLPVTVNVIVADVEVAADAANVTVGAVVSAIVTVVDCGDEVSEVCALPAVSVIEKDAAAVNVETVAPPPAVADDVAVTVHTVVEVCTIPVKAEIFVKLKSVPDTVDKLEQTIVSLPVTVNVIVPDVEVAADAANVTVGAVVSMTIAFAPAMLLAPVGTVVDVIALPVVSATVPIVNELTVKSDDVSPACTVYVPVKLVPAEAAVNITVRSVSSVTVSVFPD